jgi:hypothetical protein
MRILARVLPVVCFCGIAQVWADDSASKDAPPPDKKVTKIVLIDNDINDEDLKQILAKGYKPQGRGDKVMYCRSETEVGTRFPKKTCRTSAQILAEESRSKETTTIFQKDTGALKGN